jgi:intein/homing endonuclease
VGYNYVYRHKVSKARYKITTVNGKEVVVTEDHSVMVLVNGKLVEKKPIDIHEGDVVITVV